MHRTRICSIVVALVFAASIPATAAKSLDDGKLDPAWFGGNREFHSVDEIDYLWVKPGFALAGKKLQFFSWEEPHFIGEDAEDRDTKDKRLANDLTRDLPDIFSEAFHNGLSGSVTVVDSGADVNVVGRIVDCSSGSAAAKFWVGMGAGSGSTTFDMKFVDASSGELLAALHHRVVSGTTMSTTDSKLVKWIDELAEELAQKSLEKLYASGRKARD
ncbi:MAG: DUF4410 domain-containing protein [Thermoanaerobaculia bacterium]